MWKTIATFCEERAKAAEIRREDKRRNGTPLTYAMLHTALSSLYADVLRMSGTDKVHIVQRVVDIVGSNVNDLSRVLSDMHQSTKEFFERGRMMSDNLLTNVGKALSLQLEAIEYNILERLRYNDARAECSANVQFSTTIALFENLTEQIQALRKDNTRPSLDWLANNADELIVLGAALFNLRENNVPPDQARVNLVKSLRALTDYSIEAIDEAFTPVAREWGVA
jgi:hypothetical protein